MSKSLTEQWREGTLPEGLYYIDGKGTHDIALIRNRYCPVLTSPYCEDNVFEPEFVPVEPVPSYEEFQSYKKCADMLINENKKWAQTIKKRKQLEKKLEIATKALKEYADKDKWSYCSEDIDYFYTTKPGYRYAEKALEEMEGVK